MRTRRPLRRSWTTRGCCRPRVVLPPARRAAPEKSHVIPPGVFQDLKSDCWNHAVFSIPKKSEGTQITCDIVGKLCALCCRLPVVLPPTRRAAAEKLHVIPPGVFQDLKSDRWNHAVFSTPKKSEGTQITCDIVGKPFVGESLGGRSEGARRALGGPRRCLGGARPEPSLFRAASHVRGIEAHVVALEKSHVRERKLRESVRVQIWVCEEFLHVGVVASRDGTEGAVG